MGVYTTAIHRCLEAAKEKPNDPNVAMDLAEATTLGFRAFEYGYVGLMFLYMIRLPTQIPDSVLDVWKQNLEDTRTGFLDYFVSIKSARRS